MTQIQPTYVTFEQAKLLKEKGFYLYGYLEDVWLGNRYEKKKGRLIEIPIFGLGATSKLPEQWQVVEWLRVNHNIWVYVPCYTKVLGDRIPFYQYHIRVYGEQFIEECLSFKTPQEAYSSAFDYVLNNLI